MPEVSRDAELLQTLKDLRSLVDFRWEGNPGFEIENKRHNEIVRRVDELLGERAALSAARTTNHD